MINKKHHKKQIILASGSKRRIDILSELKVPFKSIASNVNEPDYDGEKMNPEEYAVHCARLKAREVARKVEKSLVIGMDTIGEYEGRVLGKPGDHEHARRMINYIQGTKHNVITGICIIDSDSEDSFAAAEITKVKFAAMSEKDIEKYLNLGAWKDVAAGYAIQGIGSLFIEKIEGDYFNVVGFPIFRFNHLMKQMGMPILELIEKGLK
jgi:septum formation protein